jgi:hypothetical protein
MVVGHDIFVNSEAWAEDGEVRSDHFAFEIAKFDVLLLLLVGFVKSVCIGILGRRPAQERITAAVGDNNARDVVTTAVG